MAWQVEWLILWKMIVKMLTHIHMMVYTWWCWHIYKGDKVGVDVDQLDDETEARRVRNSTGALYRNDRVSQSGPDVGHVVTGRWGPASGQWRQRACRRRSFDRTLALIVTGRWQGASGQADVR